MRRADHLGIALVAVLVTAACIGSNNTDGAVPTATSGELLAATFDQGPGPFTVTTYPEFSADVVNGAYRIRILADESYPRSYAHLLRETRAVTVFVDGVEVTSPTTGDPDLVGVGCSTDDGDGYFFAADNNGDYLMVKRTGGGRNGDVLRTGSFRSLLGSGKIDRLSLTCVGAPADRTKLLGSVNGTTVITLYDYNGFDMFTTMALTLSADRGTEARFDNVLALVPAT